VLPRRCVYAGSEPAGGALLTSTARAVLLGTALHGRAWKAAGLSRLGRGYASGDSCHGEYASGDPCHCLARKRGCVPGKPLLIGPSHAFPQVARFLNSASEYASGDPCHSVAQIRGCVLGRALLVAPSHRCGNGHVNAGAGAQQRRRLHAATQTLACSGAEAHYPFAVR